MKRHTKALILSLVALCIAIAIAVGAVFVVRAYSDKQYASLHEGCHQNQTNHLITIKNDKANPATFQAQRCETLTITNLDDVNREMAFGLHDDHVAYDGVLEKFLQKGESFTVNLIQTGSFRVHDHENDDVEATFVVK
jgi:hypothetical protein